MKNNTLKIVDKFPYPGSRYKRLGPQSGEEFKDYLYKNLKSIYGAEFNKNLDNIVLIDLDGTQGYGSSFLEEGFGGLIRSGVPYKLVKSLRIKTEEEPELYEEIQEYIDDEYSKL